MFSRNKQPPIKSLIAEGSRIEGNVHFTDGLRIDGEPVKGPHELVRLLGPNSAGKSVVFGILRGGRPQQITIALGERPLV